MFRRTATAPAPQDGYELESVVCDDRGEGPFDFPVSDETENAASAGAAHLFQLGRDEEGDISRLVKVVSLVSADTKGATLRAAFHDRMNVYGLVMALLVTLTFPADTQEAEGSICGDCRRVSSWFSFFMNLSTALFTFGILSVLEVLDRLSMTPEVCVKQLIGTTHTFYFSVPNIFLFSGVLSFIAAVMLFAALKSSVAQFTALAVVVAISLVLYIWQFAYGVLSNRRVVIAAISRLGGKADQPADTNH